ncbi:MAG: phosphocholine cytidylyltransferase family protein [Nitrospinae bacterium]|nr:phosphocholine cytidylyltransferase family protein [Nitrospinota bacterium]MBL7020131.1 phosphocholine cytidylyltransferase family protein [Nitrospinaceae bacterium]
MNQVISKAVILAAGMGLRLKELGKDMPKGFIRLGDRPIIEHSLRSLIACGIRDIMIVTGHKGEYYENLKETYPEISTVENSKFAETGTMCSLGCARGFVDADFILLESDLIYDPVAITGLLNAPHNDCLLLSGTTNAGDEVYVGAVENRMTGISKNRDHIKNSIGEYVGIAKISKQLYDRLLQVADPNLKLSYDMECMAQIASEHPIYLLRMEGLHWAEIDDLAQLTRAQKVWERIKAT